MAQHEPQRDIDLTEFRDLRGAGRHECGPACAEARRRRFPSATNLRWEKAFGNNPDLLGRLMADILKAEKREPGRHGPRPGLDRVVDAAALDRLRGLDPTRHPYSLQPFPVAFRQLLAGRSVRSSAVKVDLPAARVHRLKNGTAVPTMQEMERIAEVYDHHPAYFLEYRQNAIYALVATHLGRDPEFSISFYERLWLWAGSA